MSDDLKYLEDRKVIPNMRLIETARRDEARFLTLILRNKELMQDAFNSKVSFRNFLIEEHAHFYGFIGDFYDRHRVLPTEQTFRSRLEEFMNDDAAISAQVIAFQNRFHAHVDKDEYGPLKEGLIDRHVQQQLYERVNGGQRIVDMISATSGQRPALNSLISDLQRIDSGLESERHIRVSTAAESVARVKASLLARRENPEIAYGIMTNYPSIDTRFLGFEPGKYMIILGPPHGCKTTMMLNLSYGMAKLGHTVIFVTMESLDDEIMERLVAIESGVPSLVMKDGKNLKNVLTMDALNAATDRVERIVGDKFILISVPQNTEWSVIRSLIETQLLFRNVDAFYVDYLDVIKKNQRNDGRADLELADLSVEIQAYAKNTGVFGVTAQSFNNEMIKALKKQNAFEKPDEAAVLAGGEGVGGSQKLWRDADYMLAALPFKKGRRITMVVTKARRDGNSEDVFYLGWDPETGRVFEYESKYYVIDTVQDACKGIVLDEPPQLEVTEKIEIKDGEEIVHKVEDVSPPAAPEVEIVDPPVETEKPAEPESDPLGNEIKDLGFG